VAYSCQHGNESSGYIKGGEFNIVGVVSFSGKGLRKEVYVGICTKEERKRMWKLKVTRNGLEIGMSDT
jgi:hypothetical protein